MLKVEGMAFPDPVPSVAWPKVRLLSGMWKAVLAQGVVRKHPECSSLKFVAASLSHKCFFGVDKQGLWRADPERA